MKDAKQFFSDFANSEALRSGILEEMNRLRDGGEAQEIWQVKACTSREEMLELAKEENLELSIEDLDGAAGGIWEYVPVDDGDERTDIDSANAHESYKRGEIGYAGLDW